MQQYLDQKHLITVNIDGQPEPIVNLGTGTPALGTTLQWIEFLLGTTPPQTQNLCNCVSSGADELPKRAGES